VNLTNLSILFWRTLRGVMKMARKFQAHLLVTAEQSGKLVDLDWSMIRCVGNVRLRRMGIKKVNLPNLSIVFGGTFRGVIEMARKFLAHLLVTARDRTANLWMWIRQ